MLSVSSVLHYFDARYGPLPIIGGKPVHTRSSAGGWIDQQGVLQSAIVNTPRFEWATLVGERRQVMRLELARTTLLTSPRDFNNAAWTKVNGSIATGIDDPTGGTGAQRFTATGAAATLRQTLSAGSSLARSNSLWCRRANGAGAIKLWSPDTGTVNIMSSNGLDAIWRRFSAVSGASTTRDFLIEVPTNGDAIDLFGGQLEDGGQPTSDIAAGTRAADVFYWQHTVPPQAQMCYVRFIERGAVGIAGGKILFIGTPPATGAFLYIESSGSAYRAGHHNGTTLAPTGTVGGTPAYGDTVELLLVLLSTGSVDLYQRINSGAPTSAGPTGANTLAAAWGGQQLYLNSNGVNNLAVSDFAEVKCVKYADVVASTALGRLDELSAFEMNAPGEVINTGS